MNNIPYWQLIISLVMAYIGTRLLVPINIKLAIRTGILAIPNERNIHILPTPTAGGFSFAIVMIVMQFILGVINWNNGYGIRLVNLGGISILLLLIGLIDDKYQTRFYYKLLGQIVVTLLMFYAGYRVSYLTNPLGDNFLLGWISLPVTIFWFLLTMNAINLIDGLDGLAAGITCIVSIVLAIVGFMSNNLLVLSLTMLLLGSNLAFLKFNFYPAKIFMGDTGSLIIGLNIAAISTAGVTAYKGITTMTLMVPIIVMAVPLIDTILAVFRRIGKRNIFLPDKAHLHHYLLRLGLPQKAIALLTYFITFLFGLAAIGFSFTSYKIFFSLLVALLSILIITIYILIHKGQK